MVRRRLILFAIPVLLSIATGVAVAQRRVGSGRARLPEDRAGIPNWSVDERFKNDVFTFVRIEYNSAYGGGRGMMGGQFGGMGGGRRGGGGRGMRGGGGGWLTDWPDSDLNFSFRVQQLTSLKVNPVPISLRLTEPELFDYPFIYIIEPGLLVFSEEEAKALRKYLLNGGFLMVDDFWGQDAWDNFYEQIRFVFPEEKYEPVELPLTHEIFQCVYRLKEKPQVNNIGAATWGREEGITWENHGPNSQTVHYWGISDDRDRLMAIICHNTDLGDGWEREGENEWYFHEFSEKKAYPMGINIVTYAMTH
jgi:hypothetical protein